MAKTAPEYTHKKIRSLSLEFLRLFFSRFACHSLYIATQGSIESFAVIVQHVQTCCNMHRHVRTVSSFQAAFVQPFFFLPLMKRAGGKGRGERRVVSSGHGRIQSAPVGATSNMWQGCAALRMNMSFRGSHRRCLSIKCQSKAPHLVQVCCHCCRGGGQGQGQGRGRDRVVGLEGLGCCRCH